MRLTEKELKKLFEKPENQRLVMKFIKPYSWNEMIVEELKHEGNIALWEASLKYDETRGVKFSTFAYRYVQSRIVEAMAKMSGAITLSKHLYRKGCSLRKTGNKTETGLDSKASMENQEYTVAEKNAMAALQAMKFVPFDAPCANDASSTGSTTTLADILPDTVGKSPFELLAEQEQYDCLQNALKSLDKRKLRILMQYYGLNGTKQKMLKDIARDEGISIPRCTQIKADAIQQLRQYMKCA